MIVGSSLAMTFGDIRSFLVKGLLKDEGLPRLLTVTSSSWLSPLANYAGPMGRIDSD